MIQVVVLGAGAGGGFPQWNSGAAGCQRARAGDPQALARTQTSVAVSGDGERWFVLNAAPDLRAQIEATPELHPRFGPRHSPIAGVVLAGSEIDAVVGLLVLREAHRFSVFATPTVLAHLDENPMFAVLNREIVPRVALALEVAAPLLDSGLTVVAFSAPGKTPLYKERAGDMSGMAADGNVGLEISDGSARLLFIPGCARVDDGLRARMAGADALFFDGTLWRDDEMAVAGIAPRTGRDMGHMSVGGADGVLAVLGGIDIPRRVLIHINNSNPILLSDSPEYAEVRRAGWDVAFDGMRFTL
jgi:pyrroloquinoline quinone biosynthesis protein B